MGSAGMRAREEGLREPFRDRRRNKRAYLSGTSAILVHRNKKRSIRSVVHLEGETGLCKFNPRAFEQPPFPPSSVRRLAGRGGAKVVLGDF